MATRRGAKQPARKSRPRTAARAASARDSRRDVRGRRGRHERGGDMTEPVIFGTHDAKTRAQLRDVASRAERVALMADGHVGYIMPIGGVAAYRDQVSVVGVGFDIDRKSVV